MKYITLILSMLLMQGCSASYNWKSLPTHAEDEAIIYVVSHGWHTGIVIPGKDLLPELGFLNRDLEINEYYEFGWGDGGFYQAKEITTGITLKAIFWPTKSVMHVVGIPGSPDKYFPHSKTIALKVSRRGLTQLQNKIYGSFYKPDGHPVKIKEGIYGESLFYEGHGKYYMTNTCNTWTARVLKSGGAPVGSFLTLTAGSVMKQADRALRKYECCH